MKVTRQYRLEPEKTRKSWDITLPPVDVEEVAIGLSQVADWGVLYLDAMKAWTGKNARGENAVIGILDTGIADHIDLNANRRKAYDKNFTGDTGGIRHPHGTHCAGIAAAADNNTGIVGIAPAAGLVDVQVLNGGGSGAWSWVSAGVRHVADMKLTGADAGKVKIISMSLGGGAPADELEQAINYAISKGCIVIAAAGNSGFREGQSTVNWPGAYPQVITVAALDPDNDNVPENQRPAAYSSAGPAVDVAAPGTNVLSTVLDNGYARFNGTSMATPAVAGVAALIATVHKDFFPADNPGNQKMMEDFLRKFAIDLMEKGFDVRTGTGAPIVSGYLDQKPGQDTPPPPPPPPPAPVGLNVRFRSPAFNYSRGEHAEVSCVVRIQEGLQFWVKIHEIRAHLRMVSIINEGESPADLIKRIQDQVAKAGLKAEGIEIKTLPSIAGYEIV